MRPRSGFWPIVAAIAAGSTAANAAPLKLVEVAASAVACIYSPSCSVTADESVGQLTLKDLDEADTAWLQSRTFTGVAAAPGAGKTGYEYRFDLTQASGPEQCVGGIVLNFGPIAQLPFKNDEPADVYVVTQGGPGTIGLRSAEQDGDVVTFTFAKLVCASPASALPNPAKATFLFGLASAHPPTATTAGVFVTGKPPYYIVPARAPKH